MSSDLHPILYSILYHWVMQ